MFKAVAGNDHGILKGHKSEEPHTPQDVRAVWLRVIPRLVVAIGEADGKDVPS
jgi:hypothetical protein